MRLLLLLVLMAPQEAAQRLKAGQEKIKLRDFDGAIPELEKCLELDSEEFNASFGLGICFWEKERYPACRTQFRRVVELVERKTPGATLTTVHQKLLGCALLLEDFDDAVTESTLLLKDQERAEYYYDRALARQRKGDLNGALDDCAAALREDSQMAKVRVLRATIVHAKGDPATALSDLDQAARAKPSDPSVPLARGCLHLLQEQDAEALAAFRASLKVNFGQTADLELRAVAHALVWVCERRAGRDEAAAEELKTYQAALKIYEKDPKKNHLLCLPLYLGGVLSEAELLKTAEAAVCRPAQARCEAWAFIGERKRLAKDGEGARAAFQAAWDTRAQGTFEHALAAQRLKEQKR
jgi:tetratricopeptide (TPR) repeat protein